MKAFAYLRVSGISQVDGDGFPRQLAAVKSFAKSRDMKIAAVFEEKGVCGATEWDNRPAWMEMLAAMNGCRTIIIERLDRLARDLMVQEHIIADLRKRGIELISVYEPDLGSTDPSRVAFRQMMGVFAQYDKAMVVMKLRGARQRMKVATGRCEGRKPYGHYPGEAEVLAQMREWGAQGESLAGIALMLNRRGTKPRMGREWYAQTVGRILGRK